MAGIRESFMLFSERGTSRPLLPTSKVSKEYILQVPWSALFLLSLLCLPLVAACALLVAPAIWSQSLLFQVWLALIVLCVALLLPRRVVREQNTMQIDYLLHTRTVHLDEVLEISVVNNWAQFCEILIKWGCFPFGSSLHLFFGIFNLGFQESPACVVLTSRCCWSYILSLEEQTTAFLLDNQRSLDLNKKYTTVHGVMVRQGASMTSPRVAIVPADHVVIVEEQRGRRIRVHFEGSHISGWMSYVSLTGRMLLAVHQANASQRAELMPGLVGASPLTQVNSYGAAIELPAVPPTESTKGDAE